MNFKIIIAGPRGRMGQEALQMVEQTPEFQLVACIDRKNNGKMIAELPGLPKLQSPIYENPEECFATVDADILVDLTTPEVGYNHTQLAIRHQIRPVVGTSGFTNEQIEKLTELSNSHQVGCLIAPNFAVGAVLMMQFAQKAAKFLPDVEIIEKHHNQKLDAPSGTAIKTIDLIDQVRETKGQGHPDETETLPGARGAERHGMRVHSVRLPGLVAHQEVIFGGEGQNLTIKHDSFNRQSFMSGVKLAIKHVVTSHSLTYGLENLLDID